MRAWKKTLVQAIIDEISAGNKTMLGDIETERAVKFSAVARKLGRDHIAQRDIMDVGRRVVKEVPSYHMIQFFVTDQQHTGEQSLWRSLYFTDLEFDGTSLS